MNDTRDPWGGPDYKPRKSPLGPLLWFILFVLIILLLLNASDRPL